MLCNMYCMSGLCVGSIPSYHVLLFTIPAQPARSAMSRLKGSGPG